MKKKRAGKSAHILPVESPDTLAAMLIEMSKSENFTSVAHFLHNAIYSTETLANYVYRKRLEANVTQKDLGVALGFTSQQYISNLERGVSLIAPQYLSKICKHIKCSYDEILILYFAEIIKRELKKVL